MEPTLELEQELNCIISTSLPYDLSLKIASLLQVRDVCALGCCSRFWRDLCWSDPIWVSLTRHRWPSIHDDDDHHHHHHLPLFMGWRQFYIRWHNEMEARAAFVIKFVEQCSLNSSLEVRDYLNAIHELHIRQIGFEDVEMFLFKPELNVFLNLIGLHYSVNQLGVPAEYVSSALEKSKISERRLYVKWWKVGRWSYGFRLRDESHSRCVSLRCLVETKEGEVLRVLQRGAVYEVIRVQIAISDDMHSSTYLRTQAAA